MLTRALMLNPPALQAAARTTGRYLGPSGQMYNVVWDAATNRLLVYSVGGSFTEIQTAISSGAQLAARTSTGAIGIYNVGSAGLVGDPVTTYPYPATTPSGYSLVSFNANADVLFVSNGGASSGGFQVRNLATGVSSGAITGYANVSTRAATYSVGDGWVTAVPQANGRQTGNPYDFVTVNNRRALKLAYPVVSPPFPVLGRVASPAVSPLPPLTGVPFILDGANTVRLVTVSLRSPGIRRAGQVFIPATVATREVDVQGDIVSVAEADWYGYVLSDTTSHAFVLLSAYFGYQVGVPCTADPQQDGSTLYRPTGTAISDDFTITKLGQPNLQVTGLQPGLAALYRTYGTVGSCLDQHPGRLHEDRVDRRRLDDRGALDRGQPADPDVAARLAAPRRACHMVGRHAGRHRDRADLLRRRRELAAGDGVQEPVRRIAADDPGSALR